MNKEELKEYKDSEGKKGLGNFMVGPKNIKPEKIRQICEIENCRPNTIM